MPGSSQPTEKSMLMFVIGFAAGAAFMKFAWPMVSAKFMG